jgi:hypothetical protein
VASLQPDYASFLILVNGLRSDVSAASTLDLRFQRLIAETAMLRLFYGLDNLIVTCALKLLTNSNYCDASPPARNLPAFRSKALAEAAILAARPRGLPYLKWTQLTDFNRNLVPFLPLTEHYLQERAVMNSVLEDMRHVRNHIAHGNNGTRAKFTTVVHRIYLGRPRGISPGKLLLSPKQAFLGAPTGGQPVIEQYLLWARLAAKSLTKG